MRRRADVSKARHELGYVPTPLERAIEDAYAWFLERGEVTASPATSVRRSSREVSA
jgi:hypothetical protein